MAWLTYRKRGKLILRFDPETEELELWHKEIGTFVVTVDELRELNQQHPTLLALDKRASYAVE